MRHMPCVKHEQWFTFAWWMSFPGFDFTTMHLITRAQGKSDQGKSTVANVLTTALYGESYTDKSTVASLHCDAAMNPLVVDDNMESRDFYGEQGRANFYLGAATGSGKQKRDTSAGTSGMVIERVRALILSNGIESIAKSEQTSRMMIIECNRDLYGSDYTSAVLLEIKRERDRMLSAIFQLTGRVLKRMQDNDWHELQAKLQSEYKNHPKNRMFEHVALMILYLEEYFLAVGKTKEDVWKLVEVWMASQKESATAEILGTDPIVEALDLIREAAWKQREYDQTHFPTQGKDQAEQSRNETKHQIERSRIIRLDVQSLAAKVSSPEDGFELAGTSGALVSSFTLAMKQLSGRDFPNYKSQVLTQRIDGVEKELLSRGYTIGKAFDSHKKQWVYTFSWKGGEMVKKAA